MTKKFIAFVYFSAKKFVYPKKISIFAPLVPAEPLSNA